MPRFTDRLAPAGEPLPLYGLDIETDTTVDGLDPAVAAIVAVAVDGVGVQAVLDGDEARLLRSLDDLLRGLPAGVLVTWNGAGFDLPFIADRAGRAGVGLGLRLAPSPGHYPRPLAGHRGAYHGHWFGHGHLDGYRLFRGDVGRALPVSCGLKNLARLVGLDVVEVDRRAIHRLGTEALHDYVRSDARLARQLVERRGPLALAAVDPRGRTPSGPGTPP